MTYRERYRIYIYIYIYIYICIYIYIYIYCHPQTDCFALSNLSSMARHVGHSKPGSKPIQIYVRLSLRPLGQQAYHVRLREFLRYYLVTAAAVCLYFHTLSATRVLNSFEELCIMRAAAKKFLHQSAQERKKEIPNEKERRTEWETYQPTKRRREKEMPNEKEGQRERLKVREIHRAGERYQWARERKKERNWKKLRERERERERKREKEKESYRTRDREKECTCSEKEIETEWKTLWERYQNGVREKERERGAERQRETICENERERERERERGREIEINKSKEIQINREMIKTKHPPREKKNRGTKNISVRIAKRGNNVWSWSVDCTMSMSTVRVTAKHEDNKNNNQKSKDNTTICHLSTH